MSLTIMLLTIAGALIGCMTGEENRNKLFGNKVKLVLFTETGGSEKHFVKQKDIDAEGNVTPAKTDTTFKVDKDKMIMENGFKTYYFHSNDVSPMDIQAGRTKVPKLSSKEYNTAIKNSVLTNLMKVTEEGGKEKIMLIMMMGCLAGLGYLGYMIFDLTETISIMQENQNNITEQLKTLTSTENPNR